MEIARIEVGRTTGTCTRRGRIPAGVVGASVQVLFTDPVWDSLIKTVVFRGKETRIAEFDGTVAVIPHEVVAEPGTALYFGIFGHDPETDLQIPLIEVRLGTTEKATDANADPGTDPALPIWAQLQKEIEEIKQQGPGPEVEDGEDGGYYTPAVTQLDEDTIQFKFTPSKPDMPDVGPVTVELPSGQGSGGNVDQEQIAAAVNEALAEAKASGEFDGAPGEKGEKGDKGDTGEPGQKGDKGDPGEKGEQGAQGEKGDKGDTGAQGDPGKDGVNGVTPHVGSNGNWFIGETDTGIPATGPAGGQGLPGTPGEEGQDGYSPVRGVDYWTPEDIAAIDADIATELAKRNQLAPEFAESMEWLEANGDQAKLYVLNDKDDQNYGMIMAFVTTEKEVEDGGYENLLPKATDTDRTTIYGEDYNDDGVNDGYFKTKRLSSSGSVYGGATNMAATGFIPATAGNTLRIANVITGGANLYVIAYNSANTKTGHVQFYVSDAVDGVLTFELTADKFGEGFNAVRFCAGEDMSNAIVTIDEEIKENSTTIVTESAWTSTGHAFVPAPYESRIIDLETKSLNHASRIIALEKGATTGSTDEAAALERIKVWDKPVYDPAPVTLIDDSRVKPALTTDDRTIPAIYAKYRALMAAHPDYIKETNMGKSSASDTFTAVDMLRFDFREPDGLTSDTFNPANLHETKPKLILMSGVHTEWVGVWGLYYALEEITTNPEFDDIRRNAHIIVIPCANPYCLTSQTAVDGWRMSHVNANGVAIHNNFGVNHSTSGSVGEYNYGGSTPYSEPETQYIDAVMAEYPDAVAFVSCHNNDYSTMFGAPVIWASSATYHMCNMTFRLVDKLTKAWLDKYGDTLKNSIDQYKINMDASDYRLGRATMSTSKGTEQLNATKYGIMGVNLEIARMMKVFSGNTDGTSEVMTHGAEVYANFMRTLLWNYDHKDKREYAPNLPWTE